MKRLAYFSLILTTISASAGTQVPCLKYEPDGVTLTGRVVMKTFYGPPNYGETPAEDTREIQAQLELDQPICTQSGPEPDLDLPESNQRTITLVPLADGLKVSAFAGRHISVEGTLFHAITAHHRTPLLLAIHKASDIKVTD